MIWSRQFKYLRQDGSGRASNFRVMMEEKEHFKRNEKWRIPSYYAKSKYGTANHYREKKGESS